ncbi:MAG: hypothetical protein AAGA18_06720 [Verrucomicrobiota bacterium]
MGELLKCRKCGVLLKGGSILDGSYEACPSCQASSRLKVYPAYFDKIEKGKLGQKALGDKEATCYFHPDRKAVAICDECGKFVCELCAIPDPLANDGASEGVLCPECYSRKLESSGRRGGREEVFLYDGMAVSLAVVPLIPPICIIMYWAIIFTAPAALFLSIAYWGKTRHFMPRSKIRNIVAIVFSLLQVLFLIGIVVLIVTSLTFGEMGS